jgi:hypothetical protein
MDELANRSSNNVMKKLIPILSILLIGASALFAYSFEIKDVGYRKWSGDDCKAFLRKNDGYCTSGDCKALLRANDGYCDTNDCKAVIRGNDGYCQSGDCKAILRKNDGRFDIRRYVKNLRTDVSLQAHEFKVL